MPAALISASQPGLAVTEPTMPPIWPHAWKLDECCRNQVTTFQVIAPTSAPMTAQSTMPGLDDALADGRGDLPWKDAMAM